MFAFISLSQYIHTLFLETIKFDVGWTRIPWQIGMTSYDVSFVPINRTKVIFIAVITFGRKATHV
jgi:hypothetical protein